MFTMMAAMRKRRIFLLTIILNIFVLFLIVFLLGIHPSADGSRSWLKSLLPEVQQPHAARSALHEPSQDQPGPHLGTSCVFRYIRISHVSPFVLIKLLPLMEVFY